MSEPDSPRHPYWLWKTKRLFPHPLFAGCVSLAFLTVGILFAGVAIDVEGAWPMAVPSALFFVGCFVTAVAAVTPYHTEPARVSHDDQPEHPTFAIFAVLIGSYAWLLTLLIHLSSAFFTFDRGSPKYLVTVGLALAASAFMRFYGNRVVLEYFGATGVRQLELSGRQAIYVTMYCVSFGIYIAWLIAG